MTVQDLTAKALVHFDGFYFAQIKNKRVNSYAIDFMASQQAGKSI